MSQPTPWLVRPRPNPQALLRLFCFHHAGGGASTFRSWAQKLSAEMEICAVQLPGRESRFRETPFTRLPPLVEALAPVVTPLLDKPYAFFGHSMGGLVAYELTRQLRRSGKRLPVGLLLSARRAPHMGMRDEPAHNQPDDAFRARLERFTGSRPSAFDNAELLELMMPVLRADFAVVETYVYDAEPPLDMPITVFGGLQDPMVIDEDLEGWRQHTTDGFQIRMVPGEHFFIQTEEAEFLKQLAEELNALRR